MVGPQATEGSPAEIQPSDDIYRRILPDWIVADEKAPGGKRVTSAAFRKYRDGSPCSGYVAKEASIDVVLGPRTDCSVGAVTVEDLLAADYRVERDVVPGEHPSHVHLIEPTGLGKRALKDRWDTLAARTRWIHGPKWGQWALEAVLPAISISLTPDTSSTAE